MRVSWDEYALKIAKEVSLRSEDPYIKVGAVALRQDNSIISVGYNGSPPKISINWDNREERRKRVCHAELACLRYCKPLEVKLMAVTLCPCSDCMKQIAMYKIPRVIYIDKYERDDFSVQLAKEFEIDLCQIKIS